MEKAITKYMDRHPRLYLYYFTYDELKQTFDFKYKNLLEILSVVYVNPLVLIYFLYTSKNINYLKLTLMILLGYNIYLGLFTSFCLVLYIIGYTFYQEYTLENPNDEPNTSNNYSNDESNTSNTEINDYNNEFNTKPNTEINTSNTEINDEINGLLNFFNNVLEKLDTTKED